MVSKAPATTGQFVLEAARQLLSESSDARLLPEMVWSGWLMPVEARQFLLKSADGIASRKTTWTACSSIKFNGAESGCN
jgi:hypothetical protein